MLTEDDKWTAERFMTGLINSGRVNFGSMELASARAILECIELRKEVQELRDEMAYLMAK